MQRALALWAKVFLGLPKPQEKRHFPVLSMTKVCICNKRHLHVKNGGIQPSDKELSLRTESKHTSPAWYSR